MNDEEEILDLVDAQDGVIGSLSRAEVYARGLHNYRVVNAFVVNSDGKLWIPRRTAHKRIAPRALDMSVGGHVSSGDSYDDTFRRETSEELNIDIDTVPWRLLGKLTPADGFHCFQQVYEIKQDAVPQFNPDDFTEYFWLTPAEVIARIEAGDTAKSDLPKLVSWFYLK